MRCDRDGMGMAKGSWPLISSRSQFNNIKKQSQTQNAMASADEARNRSAFSCVSNIWTVSRNEHLIRKTKPSQTFS